MKLPLVSLAVAASTLFGAVMAVAEPPSPVIVTLPKGLVATTTLVLPASSSTKLVVINFLRIHNRSRMSSLEITYRQFSLSADDGNVYPVSPRTKSLIGALSEGSLPIGGSTDGSIAFEVPEGVVHAVLNFYSYQYDVVYPSSY